MRFLLAAIPAILLASCAAHVGYLDGAPLEAMRTQTVLVYGDGYVLTAKHVAVELTADAHPKVRFSGGQESDATVAWTSDDLDIALIKVTTPAGYEPVAFNCTPVKWGEPILVVGAPYELRWTITDGVISTIDALDGAVPDDAKKLTMTNAAINPGNSGGPVFGIDGRVRGIALMARQGNTIGGILQSSRMCAEVENVLHVTPNLTSKTQISTFD